MAGAGEVSEIAAELAELEAAMADPERMDELDKHVTLPRARGRRAARVRGGIQGVRAAVRPRSAMARELRHIAIVISVARPWRVGLRRSKSPR